MVLPMFCFGKADARAVWPKGVQPTQPGRLGGRVLHTARAIKAVQGYLRGGLPTASAPWLAR